MDEPIIERAARALQEDIGLDPGEAVDAARAVLRAIREPSEGMMCNGGVQTYPDPFDDGMDCAEAVWQAMIDTALGEVE